MQLAKKFGDLETIWSQTLQGLRIMGFLSTGGGEV